VSGSNLSGKQTGETDVRWRVTTPSGLEFTCRVYSNHSRIEVSLTDGDDALLCARVVSSAEAAGILARRWLRVVVSGETVSEPFSFPTVVH
jgi:hypothetical protein